MLLQKEHLSLIRDLNEENFQITKENEDLIKELEIMGFLEIEDKVYLTPAGKKLKEIAQELLDKIKESEINYIVGPEVVDILDLVVKTGIIPERWKDYLKQRGLYSEELTELAKKLLEAYKESLNYLKLNITNEELNFLASLVPGPAELKELVREMTDEDKKILRKLVMLKLITFSVDPTNEKIVYQITPPGKILIRLFYEHLLKEVTEDLLAKLKKSKEEDREFLKGEGFIDENNYLTEKAQLLLKAKSLIGKDMEIPIPYFIMNEEVALLKLINQYWEKYGQHGTDDLIPTEDLIFKKAEEELKMDKKLVDLVLNFLFLKGFVKNTKEKKYMAIDITEKGKDVMKFFDDNKDVTTIATKAVLYGEINKAPIHSWLEEAQELGLIKGQPTKKGKKVMELSKDKRKLLLTKYSLLALEEIPRKRYISVEDLIEKIKNRLSKEEREEEKLNERIREALSQAEAFGVFIIERNDSIILTDVGEKLKDMLEYSRSDEIINTLHAINPRSIEILKTFYEKLDEIKKEIKKGFEPPVAARNVIAKELNYDLDYVSKWLKLLHLLGLIGDRSLTEGGKKLLEAVDLLERKEFEYYSL
jgi:hypothetical protein